MLQELFTLKDDTYAALLRKLLPTLPPERIIGVRAPDLKALAKKMRREGTAEAFLQILPHEYHDENQLHAFILCEHRDLASCIERVNAFLPYVDNWATCDSLLPKAFAKAPEKLLPEIEKWMASPLPFTVRFGMGTLMRLFLDERFRPEYAASVAAVRSDEYYVNMMIAWYFATALAKQYNAVLPYFENRTLSVWTHNKAITKALESYRVTNEHKEYLRTLRIKK